MFGIISNITLFCFYKTYVCFYNKKQKYKNNAEMSIRENETKNRFKMYRECSVLLSGFFEKGFKSYPALKAIVQHYHPEVDVKKLKLIWNMNSIDFITKQKLEDVFEKLKSE